MQYTDWLTQYLEKVSSTCEEGRNTVDYLRAHHTKIGFKRAIKSVGAFWTLPGNIRLNSVHHTYESTLTNPRAWTLLIHETKHLQQGWFTALSVYGELEAWQLEFRVYKKLMNSQQLVPALEELLTLPLDWDRANLRRARDLMQAYAGKGYRVDLLPLYPMQNEINYWITRKEPTLLVQ